MFKINEFLLSKFGWYYHTFETDNAVYHIDNSNNNNDNKCYFIIIKIKNKKESIYIDPFFTYLEPIRKSIEKNGKNKIEIKSNIELLSLIKKYNAWDKTYERHFKLSNVLNK